MTKTIDTLVDDIYGMISEPHKVSDENLEWLSQGIASIIKSRLEAEKRAGHLRLSNVGKPDRQVWYDVHAHEKGEDLPPAARLKFLFGDVWEQVLLFLAKEAGHTVTDTQVTVELEGVEGHPDACIDGVPVDIKSASSASFKKFKNGSLRENDPFGYMDQLASYVEARWPGSDGAFLAVDKQLGHLTLLRIPAKELQERNVRARVKHMKEVVGSAEPPPKCFEPVVASKGGNLALSLTCSYCSHKFHCWGDSNGGIGLRSFLYSTGPKHLVHVEDEPNVPEVTF